MKLIIGISVWCALFAVFFSLAQIILGKRAPKRPQCQIEAEPFIFSEYYARMEQAALAILEGQEPVDQTIILWWGLDGLRLNEDGSMDWISRRKLKPTAPNAFYQPCQSIQSASTLHTDFCQRQSTRAQIDALMAQNANLQMQAAQNVLNAAIISQIRPSYMQSAFASPLQQCCVQYPVQYPSYYQGGCCRIN